MPPMDKDDIAGFIRAYSSNDRAKIAFAWNGKEGEGWADGNAEFRTEIGLYLLEDTLRAPGELLRDLLLAEADFCRESYGATDLLADLGVLLLEQGGAAYVEAFFQAKQQSFDTDCSLTAYGISDEALQALVADLKTRLAAEPEHDALEYYVGYFEDCLPAA